MHGLVALGVGPPPSVAAIAFAVMGAAPSVQRRHTAAVLGRQQDCLFPARAADMGVLLRTHLSVQCVVSVR